MEVGAVIGAAPRENIVREQPMPGDLVLLIGGRTGRDGIGGATGASKGHTVSSLESCGTEVQKGNPVEERKIQILFRIPEVAKMIKKCNDFGAGGVAVAVGELADSLDINLDAVPKKYEGLDGTEIAISESQERMAIVISRNDLELFKLYCHQENIECTSIAEVTDTGRLVMRWQGNTILDISRDFLNTNGATQNTKIKIVAPQDRPTPQMDSNFAKQLLRTVSNLNVCSQQGLVEMFDSTIGANTVLMPFGGKHYKTPTQSMCAKIPVNGETNYGSIMGHGYNPFAGEWSPFHGAVDSITESIAKIVATGADYTKSWLTLQEYFERLGDNPEKWGKPFAALLGAYYAQQQFGVYALGGKDSMSGSFEDLTVPPTLISFAAVIEDTTKVISPEFKKTDSSLYYFENVRDEHGMPDFTKMKEAYTKIHQYIREGKIISAYAVGEGGLMTSLCKMAFGNKIGFDVLRFPALEMEHVFAYNSGSIVFEASDKFDDYKDNYESIFGYIGNTNDTGLISFGNDAIELDEVLEAWEKPLSQVFPIRHAIEEVPNQDIITDSWYYPHTLVPKHKKPTVAIPVFPGTNCEIDTARAFERAGANINFARFINLSPQDIEDSIDRIARTIQNAQILALPGGFSAGDEPDGSAKFMTTILRNPKVADAVMELLNERDGLILGICNGFQGLIKTGLVPYGEFREIEEDDPTLTYNLLGRHISRMVHTKVVSNRSPWLYGMLDEVLKTPISHGEGRFYANEEVIRRLARGGQIATQYVDLSSEPTYHPEYNPNGSCNAIEGITSPGGRILGKMGHNERQHEYANVEESRESQLFRNGVCYFTGEDPSKILVRKK